MPYRKIVFANGEIYHVYNRGVAGLPTFPTNKYYQRFLSLVEYYRFQNISTSYSTLMKKPIQLKREILETLRKDNILNVEILAFCLMPNHFHFLLKQISEKGLVHFIGNVQNSYVKYLNIKEGRAGPLFQSAFKAKRIETDQQLIHVSRYIHLNPSTSYLTEIKNLITYPWSSLSSYTNQSLNTLSFINTEIILSLFKNLEGYKNFVFDQAEYQRELNKIKHLVME